MHHLKPLEIIEVDTVPEEDFYSNPYITYVSDNRIQYWRSYPMPTCTIDMRTDMNIYSKTGGCDAKDINTLKINGYNID